MTPLTAADWAARIERVRLEEPASHGHRWQTLSGPINWAYLASHAEPAPVRRQCSRCCTWKVMTEGFSRHPAGPLGHLMQCKTCVRETRNNRRSRGAWKRERVAS